MKYLILGIALVIFPVQIIWMIQNLTNAKVSTYNSTYYIPHGSTIKLPQVMSNPKFWNNKQVDSMNPAETQQALDEAIDNIKKLESERMKLLKKIDYLELKLIRYENK